MKAIHLLQGLRQPNSSEDTSIHTSRRRRRRKEKDLKLFVHGQVVSSSSKLENLNQQIRTWKNKGKQIFFSTE